MAALGWTIEHTDRDGGVITAQAPVSLRTYGDRVSVVLAESGETTVVEASSVSTGQLYDWGKGRHNIQQLFAEISARLE